MKEQTVTHLKDYKPPSHSISEVHLNLELFADKAIITNTMKLQTTTSDTLRLDGSDFLNLREVHLNGEIIETPSVEGNKLILKNTPKDFELKIITEIQPQLNKAFSGLYQTKSIYCTQMEAEGFRRMTYFLDRPDVLSVYTTTLTADKTNFPVLLSNGHCTSSGDLENGRHFKTWEDPHPKPSYLFAAVAGKLDFITDTFTTKSGRKVDLEIYTDPGQADKCTHAMKSLKESMKWDEDVYNCEYDLDLYMIVAVEDFNMGAMENKGLNVFNSKYVLANKATATDTDFDSIQSIIGHEYFHNWSGNRVTCRDWFQLSLKEGLTVFRDQEFSGDLNSRGVKRIEDVTSLKLRQFPEDAGGMAHPIRPESFVTIDNFYTATVYLKGAEVIRMMHTLVGRENFIKGVQNYFTKYDGQAATCEQFFDEIQKMTDTNLEQFRNWYSQAGTPTISVNTNYDSSSQKIELTIKQKTINPVTKKENSNYMLPFQFGFLDKSGRELDIKTNQIVLTQSSETFTFENIKEQPTLSLLRGFSAPVNLEFEQSTEDKLVIFQYDSDHYNKWNAGQQLMTQEIQAIYNQGVNSNHKIYPGFIEAFKFLLKGELKKDPMYFSKLLHLPTPSLVKMSLYPLDGDIALHAYKSFKEQLAKAVSGEVSSALQKISGESSAGYRALRAVLWDLKATADPGFARELLATFQDSTNMTDEIAILGLLAHSNTPEKETAKEIFFNKWSEDSLVMNKWFAAMAQGLGTNTDDIIALSKSPKFDATNPNKLFSLYVSYTTHNPFQFHSKEQPGYELLKNVILTLDKENPQTASRLCNAFNDWHNLIETSRERCKVAMNDMLSHDGISKNIREVLTKYLQMG